MFNLGILTISTKGFAGQREDKSGPEIKDILAGIDARVVKYEIVPDDRDMISRKLIEWADGGTVDVLVTTGGTGFSDTDVTPEATLSVVDRLVPGLPEIMRAETLKKTPTAMLSRATAGLRKKCLIINLPGSPRAVRECLEVIMPAIPHAVEIMKGVVTEHRAPDAGR